MVDFSRPWLMLPPKLAHDLSPFFLKSMEMVVKKKRLVWHPVNWRNLHFPNPLGTSGGVDKNADYLHSWSVWGPGFLEIGTVTPQPQTGNPGKTMDRNLKAKAVWNRMGFPSKGLDYVAEKLRKNHGKVSVPIFANVGKNRDTLIRKANQDYITCMKGLYPYVDAFVINISSPNTEGLRQLLEPDNVRDFLIPIISENQGLINPKTNKPNPVLLKISPDMEIDQLKEVLDVSLDKGIDGWILTNTTSSPRTNLGFPSGGGVSGAPLAEKSVHFLATTISHLGADRKDKLIVSSGGILNSADVIQRLGMGADLVQVYTALILHGPQFFSRVERIQRNKRRSS